MNLYLVGYRCTGKTSVGQMLADNLGWVFIDMDKKLSAEEGMKIQEIVAGEGWQYFREREAHLLQLLSREAKQVIATGGGVVTLPVNIDRMRGSGKVVWLQASPATIAERMLADSNTSDQRPPLQGEDALAEIEEIFKERLPLYKEAMHFQVDTDGLSPQEVGDRILRWLETELKDDS